MPQSLSYAVWICVSKHFLRAAPPFPWTSLPNGKVKSRIVRQASASISVAGLQVTVVLFVSSTIQSEFLPLAIISEVLGGLSSGMTQPSFFI